jgi:hypothetical protein
VNAADDIVGMAYTAGATAKAVVVWRDGVPQVLAQWTEGSINYSGDDINDNGWVVGLAKDRLQTGGFGNFRPWVWVPSAAGGGSEIMLPKYGGYNSTPTAIGNDGTVFGYADTPTGFLAIRWRLGVPGAIPSSGSEYIVESLGPKAAYSGNDVGDAAGVGNSRSWETPYIWPAAGGAVTLPVGKKSGHSPVNGINNHRQAVGSTGGRAALWKPQ